MVGNKTRIVELQIQLESKLHLIELHKKQIEKSTKIIGNTASEFDEIVKEIRALQGLNVVINPTNEPI